MNSQPVFQTLTDSARPTAAESYQALPEPTIPDRPSIVRSTRWTLLSTSLSKPLQLGTNLLLARALGPSGLGSLSLVNVTAVTFSGIAGIGMGEAASKFVAEYFRRDRVVATQLASLIFWASVLTTTLGLFAAWSTRAYWASSILQNSGGDRTIVLCLLLGAVNLVYSLSVNIFTGLQRFRQIAVISVMQALVVFVLTVPFALQFGVTGALSAALVGSSLCVAWALRELHSIDSRLLRLPRRSSFVDLRRVLHFSLPSWLSVFVLNPISLATFSYLATQPGGVNELGEFNSANGLKMLVAILPGLVGSTIAPAIVDESARRDGGDVYQTLLDNAVTALAFLTIPLSIVVILLSDLLFVVYGRAYSNAYTLFMPLAAGVAVSVLASPMQMAIVARNQTWWLLGMTTARALTVLTLALLWIPSSLSTGLAWASFIGEVGFAILLTEFATARGLVPRQAAYGFYRYGAAIVLLLAAAVLAPTHVRWTAALPLAAVFIVLIIRRHPVSAVWIVGSLPGPLQGPARRGLAVLT